MATARIDPQYSRPKRSPSDHKNITWRWTKTFGFDVYAFRPIRKGEIVTAFDGRLLGDDFDDWTDEINNHVIQCGPSLWREARGLAAYVNHSCEPNCGIKRRFHVVAMRDIRAGESVTWDYEMTEKSWWWRMPCKCGAPTCRKIIGSYARMPKATRAKYKGFISSWLLKSSGPKL